MALRQAISQWKTTLAQINGGQSVEVIQLTHTPNSDAPVTLRTDSAKVFASAELKNH